jgi:hypothetical protein
MALTTVSMLVILVWQPWARAIPSPVPATSPTPLAVVPSPPAAAVGPSTAPPSAPVGPAGPLPYLSLVDNEWTVVALLATDASASTEEPATQHPAAWPPQGPLLVLQQGLRYSVQPVDGVREATQTCRSPAPSRDRAAVHLPSDRVAYLGVTFPGGAPRPSVTAGVLGSPELLLQRVPSPVVRLGGMGAGGLYTIPGTGSGASVLFALAEPGFLPAATYQFDVDSPGMGGHHYLYACIGG